VKIEERRVKIRQSRFAAKLGSLEVWRLGKDKYPVSLIQVCHPFINKGVSLKTRIVVTLSEAEGSAVN